MGVLFLATIRWNIYFLINYFLKEKKNFDLETQRFNLLTQNNFLEQVRMNNEPLQSEHVWSNDRVP